MISYLYPLALQLHYAQAETSLATNSAAIARELQLHYAQAETLSGGAQMRHFLCVATSLCPSGNAVLASSGPAGWSALQLHYAQAETAHAQIRYQRFVFVATSLCPSGNLGENYMDPATQ